MKKFEPRGRAGVPGMKAVALTSWEEETLSKPVYKGCQFKNKNGTTCYCPPVGEKDGKQACFLHVR